MTRYLFSARLALSRAHHPPRCNKSTEAEKETIKILTLFRFKRFGASTSIGHKVLIYGHDFLVFIVTNAHQVELKHYNESSLSTNTRSGARPFERLVSVARGR